MRSFANAASRMRAAVARVDEDSNPMDNEGPGVLSSPTAAALGEPGGMDSRILVNLARCGDDSSMENVEGVNDSGTNIETTGVSNGLDVLPNGLVVPNGEPMSGP